MEGSLKTDKIILVLGGCRSGKSRYAMERADAMAEDGKLYLATSVPTDPEMEKRVARHQAERGPGWQTVEEPVLIDESIAVAGRTARVILVDCLTLWTSNLLFDQKDEAEIMVSVDLLCKALKACPCPVILVSNEVGYGIVPDNPLAREFRDMAGLVNQRIAAAAGQVILCAAGIPVQIKPGPGGDGVKYRHLFGPVASRRLGVSLGVDLVVHKVCTLDCVYCECGKTTQLTCQRRAWVALDRVKSELDHYWAHNDDPDFITFSGSGEPTLNKDIGEVIAHIKREKPGIRVAVLTNATLLSDPAVRADLSLADLVVPSLDAVSRQVFQKLNRPHAGILPDRVIRGIQTFARSFQGALNLEIFILPGVNDTPEELALLKEAADRINPDMIQLNSLDRPGTEAGLRPADRENLERIRGLLGPDRTQIIARLPKADRASRKTADLEAAVLETIHRRPSTCEDLAAMLGADAPAVQALLDRLEEKGRVLAQQQERGRFYQTRKD